MFSKLSKNGAARTAVVIAAVLFVGSLVAPAVGAPSALSIAKSALKTAKKADKRSKQALAEARKPGPAGRDGPVGPAGGKGDRGPQGPGAVRIDRATLPISPGCPTKVLVYDGSEFDLTACAHVNPAACEVWITNNTGATLSANAHFFGNYTGAGITQENVGVGGQVKLVDDHGGTGLPGLARAEATLLIRSASRTYSVPLHVRSKVTDGDCELFAQVITSP